MLTGAEEVTDNGYGTAGLHRPHRIRRGRESLPRQGREHQRQDHLHRQDSRRPRERFRRAAQVLFRGLQEARERAGPSLLREVRLARRHRCKSGRRQLSHWELTYWDLSPIQLHLPDDIRSALRNRVLLGDIPALRLNDKFELVWLEQRIVAELERKIRRLLKLLRQIALLLENVHRDIRVQFDEQVIAPALDGHSLHGALHPANDRFGRQYTSRSIARRARFGR